LTLQCKTTVNKNNTKLLYVFKNSGGSFKSSQLENSTFVNSQIWTHLIGNYSCVASDGKTTKTSDEIPIEGNVLKTPNFLLGEKSQCLYVAKYIQHIGFASENVKL